MNSQRPFHSRAILAFLIVGMILIVLMILAIKTSLTVIGAPILNLIATPSVTPLGPEKSCYRILATGLNLPPEKRVAQNEEYRKCLEARKAAATRFANTDPLIKLKTSTPVVIYSTPEPGRKAGAGKILENSEPFLPSYLMAENAWWLEEKDKLIVVFAITQRGDGVGELPRPWPSMLWIEVTSLDKSKHFTSEEGIYPVPVKTWRIKIIDAQNQRLVLRAENGVTFYFDVPARRFVSTLTEIIATPTPANKPPLPPYP